MWTRDLDVRKCRLLPVPENQSELVALVCANCLTGCIYASTINPRRSRGIIFWGCKFTHRYASARARNTAECFLISQNGRRTREVKKKKERRKIFRDRLPFRNGVSTSASKKRWRMRRTKPWEPERRGKSWKLYDYLARRWSKYFCDSLRGWNWICGKICFTINARVCLSAEIFHRD